MALDLNGTTNLVNMGNPSTLNGLTASPFTLMSWMNMDALGDSQWPRLINKTGDSDSVGWFFHAYTDVPSPSLRFQQSFSTRKGFWQTPGGSLSFGTEYHVAMTYNGNVASSPLMYINAVSQFVSYADAPPIGTIVPDSTMDWVVGNRVNASRSFNGRLWDVRAYTRILPPDEILSIYTARGKDSNVVGLAGRWPFFGESGASRTNQYDVSINQNTGINTPSAPHAGDPNAGHW